MKNRLTIKLVRAFLLTIMLILVICGIKFKRQLDVNSYIKAAHFSYPGVTKIQSTFTQDEPYRHNKPEGIVIHETTTTTPARKEAETFLKNWRKREAYVHAFVDQDAVVQIHTPTRAVWGAGRPANRRYIQVELCEGRNFNEFARSVNNDAIYVAYLLHKYQLKPSWAQPTQKNWTLNKKKSAKQDVMDGKSGGLGTIWSHHQVTHYLGNTTHTDPDGYFAKYGYSMQQFYQLICWHYDNQR